MIAMPKGTYERTPEMRAKWADNMRRVRVSRGWPPSTRISEKQAARVGPEDRAKRWPDWQRRNPERAAQANRNSGLASSAIHRRCDEPGCDRVIAGPAFFKHQKSKSHAGMTLIETGEPA